MNREVAYAASPPRSDRGASPHMDRFVDNETPSAALDGTRAIFTLASPPIADGPLQPVGEVK